MKTETQRNKNKDKIMTPTDVKRLADAETRIINLENQAKVTAADLAEIKQEIKVEIKTTLNEIKAALVGSTEDIEKMGIIYQFKLNKKEVEELKSITVINKNKIEIIEKDLNRYKWFIRGIFVTLSIIIVYFVKVYDIFATVFGKTP